MTKKDENPDSEFVTPYVTIPSKKEPKPSKKLFVVTQWSGVKEVFKCEQCGEFRDTKDLIIEHILTHYPDQEQYAVLEQLLKEK